MIAILTTKEVGRTVLICYSGRTVYIIRDVTGNL